MHNIKPGVQVQNVYTSGMGVIQAYQLMIKGNNRHCDMINQTAFTIPLSYATI